MRALPLVVAMVVGATPPPSALAQDPDEDLAVSPSPSPPTDDDVAAEDALAREAAGDELARDAAEDEFAEDAAMPSAGARAAATATDVSRRGAASDDRRRSRRGRALVTIVAEWLDGERARVERFAPEPRRGGCNLPCELHLSPGRYRVEIPDGPAASFDVGAADVLVEAVPSNDVALWIGIGLSALSVALFVNAAVGDGVCWELQPTRCPPLHGPVGLIGATALGFGGGLLIVESLPELAVSELGRDF